MQVLLVHGMGRTALSLYPLARDLQSDGHRPSLLGYVAAVENDRRVREVIRTVLKGAAG